jgi:short-subunit dehydrogenase
MRSRRRASRTSGTAPGDRYAVPDILITGGSDGIGLAVAKLLAAEGDTRVTLVARSEARLEGAVAQLAGAGHDFIAADLSAPDGMDVVVSQLAARHYDVLINNAGAGLYGRFAELPLDDQLRMMRLNMESVSVLSHAYLCRAKPGDALVNTASFLAYAPLPGNAVYSGTKAFVAALSEALWWEHKKDGVYVLCFCPGVIATGFHDVAGSSVAAFPRLLVRSPESAARELAAALGKRRKPRVITGFATRRLIRLQQLVGRRAAINMMGRSSPL